MESSAKNKTNLVEIFLSLSKEILENKQATGNNPGNAAEETAQVNLNPSNTSSKENPSKNNCC
jgi:hypothetical protein